MIQIIFFLSDCGPPGFAVWAHAHSNERYVYLEGWCARLAQQYVVWYSIGWFLNFISGKKLAMCLGWVQAKA